VLQAIKEEIRQNGVRSSSRNVSTDYIVEDVDQNKAKRAKKGTARDRLTKKVNRQRRPAEEDM